MTSTSVVGSGTGKHARKEADTEVTLADVVKRLTMVEDLFWLMHPVPDHLAALEATVHEQGQQQITLNLALMRVEQALQEAWPCQQLPPATTTTKTWVAISSPLPTNSNFPNPEALGMLSHG
jgi:hypothetical protein